MHIENRRASDEPNLVASFKTAVMSVSGAMESVCIKYAMYDRTERLSHWSTKQVLALYKCLEYYSGVHYYGSELQRISDDPNFAAMLPARHPVLTMANERPDLTQRDYSEAHERFSVVSLMVDDQGEICRIHCTFADGKNRIEAMPAYIAMNLYGSLKAGIDLSSLVTSQPRGRA